MSHFENPYQSAPSTSALSSSERKVVFSPIIRLPDTPPVSPKLGSIDSISTFNMSHSIQINTSTGQSHRHTFSSATPSGDRSPTSHSSSLTLPPLITDHEESLDGTYHYQSEDDSPTVSGLLTPTASPGQSLTSRLNDHIASIASMSAPDLGLSLNESTDDLITLSQGFPLLPPNHPLRKSMMSSTEMEKKTAQTPPQTPKGHPLEKKRHFPFVHTKTKSYPISKPQPYTTTLSYLLRIPRRHRPVLLFSVVVATFGFAILSRIFSSPHRHESPVLKRFIAHNVQQASQASSVISSTSSHVIDPAPITFLNKEEELLALINFITSTTSNSLPSLNPTLPLDPSIVLDFDPTRPTAREDLDLLRDEVNAIYPILLLGRMRDPWHREIKKMLAEYKIVPAPLIIEVDQRRDHSIFIPLIARLLESPELPQLLVLGRPVGTYHDILALRDSGKLKETLEASGAVTIRDAVIKKKGMRERERLEMERLLRPKPIVAR